MSYSPWVHRESDMTEQLTFSLSFTQLHPFMSLPPHLECGDHCSTGFIGWL